MILFFIFQILNVKKPKDIAPSTRKKVWWICQHCGHEWEAGIRERTKIGKKCQNCIGTIKRKLSKSYNLKTEFPRIASEWHPLLNDRSPKQITPFTSKMIWWLCQKCGYLWKSSVHSRTVRKSGCQKCVKRNN